MLSFIAGKTLILSIATISHTKDFCKLSTEYCYNLSN